MSKKTQQPLPIGHLKWFDFSQNNSGGSFEYDKDAGITHHVLIQALSAKMANDRAEDIGLYFDGCSSGRDCDCCGDRWSAQWNDKEGTDEPEIYGRPPDKLLEGEFAIKWMKDKPEVAIHYADGRLEWACEG